MRLEAGGIRRAIAFPMASADPSSQERSSRLGRPRYSFARDAITPRPPVGRSSSVATGHVGRVLLWRRCDSGRPSSRAAQQGLSAGAAEPTLHMQPVESAQLGWRPAYGAWRDSGGWEGPAWRDRVCPRATANSPRASTPRTRRAAYARSAVAGRVVATRSAQPRQRAARFRAWAEACVGSNRRWLRACVAMGVAGQLSGACRARKRWRSRALPSGRCFSLEFRDACVRDPRN